MLFNEFDLKKEVLRFYASRPANFVRVTEDRNHSPFIFKRKLLSEAKSNVFICTERSVAEYGN